MSHCRDPARALGSEYGLDADAFTVGSLLQFAYCWAGTAPDVVSCVQQSPTNAGPAVAHPMPSTPAPTSHTSRVREPSTRQNFAVVLGLLPWPSPLDASKCLCLASARGGLGWAGLGWAGLGCGAAPAVSFKRFRRGPRTTNNCLMVISLCPGQSDGRRIACLTCGCRMHAGHSL